MDDQDDEVIDEFDLNLLTTNRKCSLNLFSFSLKDSPLSIQNNLLNSIKVKPNAEQFEITCNFEKKTKDHKTNRKKISNENHMKHKILKSSKLPDTKLKYGICCIHKEKKILNVIPIDKIFDFQTDFNFLNNFDDTEELKKSKNELSSPNDKVQNIVLRYESSFESLPWSHLNYVQIQEKNSKEQWKSLKLINKDFSNLEIKKEIFLNEKQENSSQTKHSLFPDLNCQNLIEKNDFDDFKDENISLTKIKNLKLSEKICRLLINCKVISFSKLVDLLSCNLDEELLIKVLQKYAMLVQGNWVVKSEVLYLNKPCSDQNIIELATLHDLISYLFTKSIYIKRNEINSIIKYPYETLKTALDKFSTFDSNSRTWVFIYPKDEEFLKKYENVRVQQEISWEIRKVQFMKNLNLQLEKFCDKNYKRKSITTFKKIDKELKYQPKKRIRKKNSMKKF